MSNAKRTLEISQPWPSPHQKPETLSDCVRYLRSAAECRDPHYLYAVGRVTDAASLMAIRHPEYFT